MRTTVNRGWLKRRVMAGEIEAKCDFHFDRQYGTDTAKRVWLDARFSSGYGDFVEGQINLTAFDFRTKSGGAWRDEDGNIVLYVHSNLFYTLRLKNKK